MTEYQVELKIKLTRTITIEADSMADVLAQATEQLNQMSVEDFLIAPANEFRTLGNIVEATTAEASARINEKLRGKRV